MKKVALLVVGVMIYPLYPMRIEVYKPTVPMINFATGQGYLADMPADVQKIIVTTVADATTFAEAIQAVLTLSFTDKQFNALINQPAVIRDIIALLVVKFKKYHEEVAKALHIASAKDYLALNIKQSSGWQKITSINQAEALLKEGVDIHFTRNDGSSLLVQVMVNNINNKELGAILLYLFSMGASAHVINASGQTVLMIAAGFTQAPIVKMVLEHTSTQFLNARDQNGQTALHITVVRPRVDYMSIRYVIDAGADISIKNNKGKTALDEVRAYAQTNNNEQNMHQIVQLLEQAEKQQSNKKQ